MPNLDHIRQLIRSPRGYELTIGFALHALTPADLERLGHSWLAEPFAPVWMEGLGCEGWRDLVRREIGVSEPPAGELSAVA